MNRVLSTALVLTLIANRAMAADLNGCSIATATDFRGSGSAAVGVGPANTYTPACVLINAGQDVVFTANFAAHPLRGGAVINSTPVVDPSSPIPPTDAGNGGIRVNFATAGSYGYYCEAHVDFGMYGAIFVNDVGLLFRDGFE